MIREDNAINKFISLLWSKQRDKSINMDAVMRGSHLR